MRFFRSFSLFVFFSSLALAQGSPPMDPSHAVPAQPQEVSSAHEEGSPPPAPQSSPIRQMTALIRKQINKAIDGKPYPSLENWSPLTTQEKFHRFLGHTYAGRTFANAAVDAFKCSMRKSNPEYERGLMGYGQHYGVYLGVSETEIFFEQFLVPSVLKQDPRYFRNPRLPFFKRAAYSLSRVFITRADDGRETFNASRILGGAASQSLADLYVPGQRQGMSPVLNRVAFDLVRDAGFNLMHEFWPDLRRKFLHR